MAERLPAAGDTVPEDPRRALSPGPGRYLDGVTESNTNTVGRRRLAAILHLDVVGFSAMMSRDDEATTDRIIALHRSVQDLVEAHGGTVAGTAGDAVLAWFASIVGAVTCSVRIQEELARAGRDQPDPIRARIGIHLGDVIAEGDSVYGEGVNIAARLESACEPGGILVSDAVYHQVRHRVDVPFSDTGVKRLKNIPEPVRVFAVPASFFLGTHPIPAATPDSGDPDEITEAMTALGEIIRQATDITKDRVVESRDRATIERERPSPPSPSEIRQTIRDAVRSRPARSARRPRRATATVTFDFPTLSLLVVGGVLVWAWVTGSVDTAWALMAGAVLLGMAIGSIGESVSRVRGTRSVMVGLGIAAGALGFGNLLVRTVLWVVAAGLVARGAGRMRS